MDLKPIEKLRALIKMGLPFEQAYSQCWLDLREEEKQKKPSQLGNAMIGNTAQAKINAAKRWEKKR